MTLEILRSLNGNVQNLLEKKDYNNPTIKESLRKLKVQNNLTVDCNF